MAKVTITDLLEAGVHFGHQTKRWNPKMKEFVYGKKDGIYIIDLTKTMKQIADACNFLQSLVMKGGEILFVGTKRQAQEVIRSAAEKTQMFYVTERWLGGTLTNNATIQKSITKMLEIDKIIAGADTSSVPKKEIISMQRTSAKLHKALEGIAKMKRVPDAVVVVDVCYDDIAIKEANKLKIPVVAILDTNGDPDNVNYPIVANDDALKSIKVIIDVLAEAVQVSLELYGKKVAEDKAREEAERKIEAESGVKTRKVPEGGERKGGNGPRNKSSRPQRRPSGDRRRRDEGQRNVPRKSESAIPAPAAKPEKKEDKPADTQSASPETAKPKRGRKKPGEQQAEKKE